MAKFQRGDIVECLIDRPYGANIYAGQLATIEEVNGGDSISFSNIPSTRQIWAGREDTFVLFNPSLENE